MLKKSLIIFILLISLKSFSNENKYTEFDSLKVIVCGKIVSDSNVYLQKVEIHFYDRISLKEYKAITNDKGQYEILLEKGNYNINVSFPNFYNYEVFNIKISEKENTTIDITLIHKIYSTEVINVEDQFKQSQSDLRTSVININPKNVKILPGAIEDVLRSLKSLPGISSPNDFTSQLIIRGSGPDQNLIIMDEVEIFNPYRLYGLVSMFNPETLNDITLITGGFPSKYGDRLSAVLDVSNKEGLMDKSVGFIANINIASANIIFQGKNPMSLPGSWIISSRRTYYDLIIGPFAKKSGLITDDSSFPSFEDLQFKISFGPFKNHKLFLNGIFSRDGVDIISGKDRKEPDSVNVNDVTKNNLLSVGWHYYPNSKFISKTTLSWYLNNGNNEFEGEILDPLIDRENITPSQRDSLKAIGALLGMDFASTYSFMKYSLTNKSSYYLDKNLIEFGAGIDIIKTDLKYKIILDDQFRAIIRNFPGASAFLNDFDIEGNYNYRSHIYYQQRFNIKEKFFYQPSLRLDYYSFLNKVYLSPRINFGFVVNKLTTIRSGIGFYYQSPGYEKLIDGQTFFDLSKEIGTTLKAERAIHFILGIDRWLNSEWFAKVETYYKKFDNLIYQQKLTGYRYEFHLADPYNTDPNYIKNPANWIRSQTKLPFDSLTTIPVNVGTGNSYGIEISLEKKYISSKTKFYGWINYAYSVSKRERGEIIKPFRFDQRHVINVVLNYRLKDWLEIGARWSFASNFPYTPPLGIKPRVVNDSIVVNPLTHQVIFNLDYDGESNRFTSVKPDYHRLDLRVTAYTKFWKCDWSFYIDVINVYNRKNVLNYNYNLSSDLIINRKVVGMIPLLPTLGVSARF
jgi:hypothetical protein